MRPFRSDCAPSVADTSCWESGVNLTGSVPEVISSAIRLASAVLTPVISLPPLSVASIPFGFVRGSTVGAATSLLSTTIAL